MIYRLMAIVKHILFGIVRIICYVLRCGRRKKVQVDDTLPTDIVIGDAANSNFQNYRPMPSSALTNGYEVSKPPYYEHAQEQRHPYQSQIAVESFDQQLNETTDSQMESWEQWDYGNSSNTQGAGHPQQTENEEIQPEEDFFADMEPSVKVKKIFVKKKRRNDSGGNRFAVDQDIDFKTSGELDTWQDEDEGAGWMDEEADIDEVDSTKVAKEARELRKQERLLRSEEQKRLKTAKKAAQQRDHRLGMKVLS